MTRRELLERGCRQPDFVYISGDAYVDHPSFAHALICRLLEAPGIHGGTDLSAGLEKSGEHTGVWGAQAGFSHQQRKYGFNGEPLRRIQETADEGCLHAGGRHGKAPGSCGNRVQ